MRKLYGLIAGMVLALATPFALADEVPLQGAIEAPTHSNAFWYAGTSGYPSR